MLSLIPVLLAVVQASPTGTQAVTGTSYSTTVTDYINRDGTGGGWAGDQYVCLSSDTIISPSEDSSQAVEFVTNSLYYRQFPDTPLAERDLNAPGTQWVPQAIPYTAAELQFNEDAPGWNGVQGSGTWRYAIWPQTGALTWNLSDGYNSGPQNAITFPAIVYINKTQGGNDTDLYTSLVTITATDSNYTAVRTTPFLFGAPTPLYGHFSALLANPYDGFLYLFGTLAKPAKSGRLKTSGLALARALVGSINDPSAYTYYLPATQQWTSTPPSQTDPVDVLGVDGKNSGQSPGTGDVFWSPYHDQYLMVLFPSNDRTGTDVDLSTPPILVSTSSDLMNWSPLTTLIENPASGNCSNYAAHVLVNASMSDSFIYTSWIQTTCEVTDGVSSLVSRETEVGTITWTGPRGSKKRSIPPQARAMKV